jgi:HAD superfamily hydrolase (TIGR01509 family)
VSRVPAFPVYLFDVDGTLLDSAPDICGAIQAVLATTSIDPVPDEFLRRYIGRHLVDLFRDLFPGHSEARIDQLITDYRAVYPRRGHHSTKPFPNVVPTVAALGGRKSTATTKGTPTARTVLEMFGLAPHFDHIQGTDGFPAKPAPDVIFKSIEALGVKPKECLLVGDAGPDMEAGRRAGVNICAVRYGYGDQAEMARFEPDYWIDDIRELL